MERKRRYPRASVTDIYRSCVQGGDCPTDVKNKVEGRTWADTLLKVFGSILYLGGLGIGTGRGSGGTFGYRPFGGTPKPDTNVSVTSRPTIPTVDIIGPTDVLPVAPEDPAIVPLSEGIPETGIIDTPAGGPGLDSATDNITTFIDPISEVTVVSEHPNVVFDDNIAEIDVQLLPPPPKKIALDASTLETSINVYSRVSHVDPDINVFVNPQFEGVDIGQPEYIELDEINLRQEFEIDEGPKESTPVAERVSTRARDLYNRYVVQVPARQPSISTFVSRPFSSTFENPAFESDIITAFENDVQSFPYDNTDIIFEGQSRFSETPQRTVRLSRLGRRPGMTTRSGLDVGQRVHLYYDISNIPDVNIELQPLGELSHESTLVDELATSTFINPFENPINGFSNDDLIDLLSEDFSTSRIIVNATGRREDVEIPVLSPGIQVKVFVDDYGDLLPMVNTLTHDTQVNIPTAWYPIGPAVGTEINYYDFDIHPSLKKRKRKRNVF